MVYLVVVILTIYIVMKRNQAKNRVLSGIFWAGTDFEKSKKNWNHRDPVVLESSKKFFQGNTYYTSWTYQNHFSLQVFAYLLGYIQIAGKW